MDPSIREALERLELLLNTRLESYSGVRKHGRETEHVISSNTGGSADENPVKRRALGFGIDVAAEEEKSVERIQESSIPATCYGPPNVESYEKFDKEPAPKHKKALKAWQERRLDKILRPILLAQEAELKNYSEFEQASLLNTFACLNELYTIEDINHPSSPTFKGNQSFECHVLFYDVTLSYAVSARKKSAQKYAKLRAVLFLQRVLGLENASDILSRLQKHPEESIDAMRTKNFQPKIGRSQDQRFSTKPLFLGSDNEDAAPLGFIRSDDLPPTSNHDIPSTSSLDLPKEMHSAHEGFQTSSRASAKLVENSKPLLDSNGSFDQDEVPVDAPHPHALNTTSMETTEVTPPPAALSQTIFPASPAELLHWSPQAPTRLDIQYWSQAHNEAQILKPTPCDQNNYVATNIPEDIAVQVATSQAKPENSTFQGSSIIPPEKSFEALQAPLAHIHAPQAYIPKPYSQLSPNGDEHTRATLDVSLEPNIDAIDEAGHDVFPTSDEAKVNSREPIVEEELNTQPSLQISAPTVKKDMKRKTPLDRLRRQVYFTQHRYLLQKASFREAHLKSGIWQAEVYLGKALFVCKALSKEKRLAHIKAEMLACQTIGKHVIS